MKPGGAMPTMEKGTPLSTTVLPTKRVRAETALPQAVADHGDRMAAALPVVLRSEEAAALRVRRGTGEGAGQAGQEVHIIGIGELERKRGIALVCDTQPGGSMPQTFNASRFCRRRVWQAALCSSLLPLLAAAQVKPAVSAPPGEQTFTRRCLTSCGSTDRSRRAVSSMPPRADNPI